MRFLSRDRARALAIGSAFIAPTIVAACGLTPFLEPGGTTTTTSGETTATTTTTTISSSGGGGSGGGTTTSSGGTTTSSGGTTTSSGGTGGGGSGGGTTTSSGGTTSSSGGAGGVGGATTSSSGGSTTSSTNSGGSGGAMMDAGADGPNDAGVCGAIEASFPLEPGVHVASCTPLTYATNPPTSGTHYPIWAAFKVYDKAVPRGFYVHAMEHGAIVFEHNCASDCSADLAALTAYLDARPVDPLCVAPLKNRFIVTPDPLIDAPFTVSAWGYSLKMQCLDFAAIGAFIDAHYAKAPENFCFDGTDVTDPAAGIPAGCGDPPSDAGSD